MKKCIGGATRRKIAQAGTPPGKHLSRAVKGILPLITSSLSRVICAITQGCRIGLVRSATRYVGLVPAKSVSSPFGTYGKPGRDTTGPGPLSGDMKLSPSGRSGCQDV